MVVTKVLGDIKGTDIGTRSVDLILMAHDELQKNHQKVLTKQGLNIKISLDRGETLFDGAILLMDEDTIAAVELIEEKVFEIRPKTNIEWAKAAFNIGNMHQKAYLYDDCICLPYDAVLTRMIKALGIEFKVTVRKLSGILANVSPESAGHGHHGHVQGDHHG